MNIETKLFEMILELLKTFGEYIGTAMGIKTAAANMIDAAKRHDTYKLLGILEQDLDYDPGSKITQVIQILKHMTYTAAMSMAMQAYNDAKEIEILDGSQILDYIRTGDITFVKELIGIEDGFQYDPAKHELTPDCTPSENFKRLLDATPEKDRTALLSFADLIHRLPDYTDPF